MTVRIAVDAMGGDNAPHAIIQGAIAAFGELDDLCLTLVGDSAIIRSEILSVQNGAPLLDRFRIVHASEVIAMDAAPMEALRSKKDSSIVRMTELCASGEVDAVLSAGNTGALAAACQLKLRPLPSVARPGIAVTIPSFHGPFVLCDVGANIQARARHLHDYAVMAALYAERVIDIESPRIALISIGEESGKGTGLIKQTHKLLAEDSSINFVGNVEGRDLFEGRCDVAISDGFVGNIVLKFVEGLAEGLFRTIAREFDDEEPEPRRRFMAALDRVWREHDYARYGGAPLLGINGTCIICHGRSSAVAVCNAIKVARRFVMRGYNQELVERLTAPQRQDAKA